MPNGPGDPLYPQVEGRDADFWLGILIAAALTGAALIITLDEINHRRGQPADYPLNEKESLHDTEYSNRLTIRR